LGAIFVFILLFSPSFKADKNEQLSKFKADDKMNIVMEYQEVWSYLGTPSTIKAYYWLDSGLDMPIQVTWKVGDGLMESAMIATCTNFTRQQASCESLDVTDKKYAVTMIDMMVALQISNVELGDDRMYWCEVSIQDGGEFKFDAASTVMRIHDTEDQSLPKFHQVNTVKSLLQATEGGKITLDCSCDGSHCDDVLWYKGPLKRGNRKDAYEFTPVYSKIQSSELLQHPTDYQAYGDWVGRTQLKGNSLEISELKESDGGRYWCEIRSSNQYTIGEWATDASSVVLIVN